MDPDQFAAGIDESDTVFHFDLDSNAPSLTDCGVVVSSSYTSGDGMSSINRSTSKHLAEVKGEGASTSIGIPTGSTRTWNLPIPSAPSTSAGHNFIAPGHPSTLSSAAASSSMDAEAYLSCVKGKGKVPDTPPCLPPLTFSHPEFSYSHISWPSPSSVTESTGSSYESPSPSNPAHRQNVDSDPESLSHEYPLCQRSLSGSSFPSDSSIAASPHSRVRVHSGSANNAPGNITRKLLFKKPEPLVASGVSVEVLGIPPNLTQARHNSESSLKDVSLSYGLHTVYDGTESSSWPSAMPKGKQRSSSLPSSILDIALISSDTFPPPPLLPNIFDQVPKELRLKILSSLLDLHEVEHRKAVDEASWTTAMASSSKNKWVGRNRGIRELVRFSRVSKAWQLLVSDGQLWREIDLRAFPIIPKSVILRLVSVSGPFIQALNIASHVFMLPSSLIEITKRLSVSLTIDTFGASPTTHLRKLDVAGCTMLNTHALHYILRCSPALETLVLKGLDIVTNGTCEVLAEHCRRLRLLDMGRCRNVDADGLHYMAKVALRRHESLPLRILRLSGIKYINDAFMSALGKVTPHLEVLDLSYCRHLHNSALEAFVTCSDGDSKTSLGVDITVLTGRQVGRQIGDSDKYRRRITRLRHLNLSFCPLLTDQACSNLAHSVPRLEFLECAGIGDDLKDDGLVRLFETTPNIRRVDLEDASDISDSVVACLTPLDVQKEVDDTSRAAPQVGHALEHLIISYATNVTDNALLALVRNCKQLKVLEVDNTRIGVKVFKEFIRLSRSRNVFRGRIVAVDCRSIGETSVKEMASMTRPRTGWRAYEARKLKYLDGRDGDLEDLKIGQDECDDKRITVKTFYSWQTVDAVRSAREKRKKAMSRRIANGSGSSDDLFSSRWWSPSGRRSGTSSPTDMANRDSCTVM